MRIDTKLTKYIYTLYQKEEIQNFKKELYSVLNKLTVKEINFILTKFKKMK